MEISTINFQPLLWQKLTEFAFHKRMIFNIYISQDLIMIIMICLSFEVRSGFFYFPVFHLQALVHFQNETSLPTVPVSHWRQKITINVMNEHLALDRTAIPHDIYRYFKSESFMSLHSY